METVSARGFIVHAYTDRKRDREQLVGRLEDGRSFALSLPRDGEPCLIPSGALGSACIAGILSNSSLEAHPSPWRTFDGQSCLELRLAGGGVPGQSIRKALVSAGIPVHEGGVKGAAAYLAARGIRGGISLEGECRRGTKVDLVFSSARILPDHDVRVPLAVCSLDIETAEPEGRILAVGLSLWEFLPREGARPRSESILFNGPAFTCAAGDLPLECFPSEGALLRGLSEALSRMDPDVVTGWNVIDFDLERLAAAYARNRLPFDLGRSLEAGTYFASEREEDPSGGARRRSAAAVLPGRQVLDALRLVRSGSWDHESYTLDAVARETLGRGKTVTETGGDKLAELRRLYRENPEDFCRYCLTDARLVNEILERKGLIIHTVERSALTGAGLDKAWTSVASFERIYAEGLYARGILEPPGGDRDVSGAAGGTVLDPQAGLFGPVAVFDFRSLYPSVMRTFNVDPLARSQVLWPEARVPEAGTPREGPIVAPNGAAFSREEGILSGLIGRYFSERLAAIDRGDDAAAYVYKILMNSFYGVLGSPKCRYARTDLAGAITGFGRWCLLFARDFFTDRGYRVLYGDTDSVFVELLRKGGSEGDPAAPLESRESAESLEDLASRLNRELSERVLRDWNRESFISIRFEKLYLRFFIPHLRSALGASDDRGRAKGYAGLLRGEDGRDEVEIKGMEAARSDYTPFARRFQRELLALVFSAEGENTVVEYLRDVIARLYRGDFDGELVFRKKLRRPPREYVASTPPHVRVARSLGIEHRGALIEYVMTPSGPEAAASGAARIDREWYCRSQLLPIARSVGLAAGFDADAAASSVHSDGQLELGY